METSLDYWLHWQVPVCALIIIIPTITASILIYRSKRAPLKHSDIWVPCWRGLNPVYLLIYRVLVLVIMFELLYRVAAQDGAFAFYFYTQWTFVLVMVYFALGAIISSNESWKCATKPVSLIEERDGFLQTDVRRNVQIRYEEKGVEQRAGFFDHMMQIVFQASLSNLILSLRKFPNIEHICAGAAMLTDIVFWGLLLPFQSGGDFTLDLLMTCMHSLNAVFLLLDTSVNNLRFPWFGLVYFILFSAAYITFQWVLHACGFSWWPYAFLEISTPWAPLWYFAIALVHIPCYWFFVLVVNAKNSIFSRLFPNAYIRSF
ncbi:hypothetical protein GIB67_011337 [Kingdonia uniflora]|uniref:Transmembrane protein n=1 Tax=Kingdonia uniflora TaxID=39325 RepID=A0A7J7MNS4_9MAGN|nr:hypothetical protein GIB67_011337 [Kingdonia uniflora]